MATPQINWTLGTCGPKAKVRYRNEKEALHRARVRMGKEPGLRLRAYVCPGCRRWHLTKMPKGTFA